MVCCNTGEALNCLGMASTSPREVPCWLWRWTWHPSGIGPLWEKHQSFDLCNLNMVLKERKKETNKKTQSDAIPSLAVVHLFKDLDIKLDHNHEVFV